MFHKEVLMEVPTILCTLSTSSILVNSGYPTNKITHVFIDEAGNWRSVYTPAVLRCHPFKTVFLKDVDGNTAEKKVLAFMKNSPYISDKEQDQSWEIFMVYLSFHFPPKDEECCSLIP